MTDRRDLFDRRDRARDASMGRGLFETLRRLERHAPDKPRIGRNRRLSNAVVRMGQDPALAFPDRDIARLDDEGPIPVVRAQFLGFFGAFGAFPLNWTEEALRWFDDGDDSFVAFTDIFASRFQELFFRAWSDARPITQFDHPGDDRFRSELLALLGMGTPAWRDRGTVPDTARLHVLALVAGRVKSPVRLRQMLQVHFGAGMQVEVEEMVASWLEFEPDALTRLGMQGATLGRDVHLGSRVKSIGEKIRLHLRLPDIARYDRFLPGGPDHAHLRDLVFWYLGQAFEIEVVLWLPQPEIRPAMLGVSARLGWMACIAPDPGTPDTYVAATHYRLEPDRSPRTDTAKAA